MPRRRLGLLLLLFFLCGASGLQTELCALAAVLDPSHRSIPGFQSERGVLILAHSRGQDAIAHRHGVVARGLCVLASPSMQRADHRVVFALPGAAELSGRSLDVAQVSAVSTSLSVFEDDQPSRSVLPGARSFASSPHVSDVIRFLRSTVLLL